MDDVEDAASGAAAAVADAVDSVAEAVEGTSEQDVRDGVEDAAQQAEDLIDSVDVDGVAQEGTGAVVETYEYLTPDVAEVADTAQAFARIAGLSPSSALGAGDTFDKCPATQPADLAFYRYYPQIVAVCVHCEEVKTALQDTARDKTHPFTKKTVTNQELAREVGLPTEAHFSGMVCHEGQIKACDAGYECADMGSRLGCRSGHYSRQAWERCVPCGFLRDCATEHAFVHDGILGHWTLLGYPKIDDLAFALMVAACYACLFVCMGAAIVQQKRLLTRKLQQPPSTNAATTTRPPPQIQKEKSSTAVPDHPKNLSARVALLEFFTETKAEVVARVRVLRQGSVADASLHGTQLGGQRVTTQSTSEIMTKKKAKTDEHEHQEFSRALSVEELEQDLMRDLGFPVVVAAAAGPKGNERQSVPLRVSFEGLKLEVSGRPVLKGITGSFPPGSLVAVMGASGAGKTSVMNALAHERSAYANCASVHYSGLVTIGLTKDGCAKFPTEIGYVPQENVLFPTLTVFANLYFAARLRLPRGSTESDVLAAVEQAMTVLEIEHIRDSVVGGGTSQRKGISGGEAKRVSVAVELVARPRILFLDEPTSGLDASASLRLVTCLRRLRQLGITCIAVIHQPRQSVFLLFDVLLLVAKGETAYLGKPFEAMEYFVRLGFPYQIGDNVADWCLDVLEGMHSVRYNAKVKKSEMKMLESH
eukprot:g4438.t1